MVVERCLFPFLFFLCFFDFVQGFDSVFFLDEFGLSSDEDAGYALVILIVAELLLGREGLLVNPGAALAIFTDLDALLHFLHHFIEFDLLSPPYLGTLRLLIFIITSSGAHHTCGYVDLEARWRSSSPLFL